MAVFMVKLWKLQTVGNVAGPFLIVPPRWSQPTGLPGPTGELPISIIAGDWGNTVTAGKAGATIGGGGDSSGGFAYANTIEEHMGTISGGGGNTIYANGYYGTIAGGRYNRINARSATVGGGESNYATGEFATVPGGVNNIAEGQYSFAAGQNAHASHQGTFVWSDSTSGAFNSTGVDQFLIRASGGVGIGLNDPDYPLDVVGSEIRLRDSTDPGAKAITLRTDGSAVDVNAENANLWLHSNSGNTILQGFSGSVGIGTSTPQGTLDVNGSIYQRGIVLSADYVFEPGYALETIEEHARRMWAERHLPAVPGTVRDEQGREVIEIGQQSRVLLEELEKAHIYIEQLNTLLQKQQAEIELLRREVQALKR